MHIWYVVTSKTTWSKKHQTIDDVSLMSQPNYHYKTSQNSRPLDLSRFKKLGCRAFNSCLVFGIIASQAEQERLMLKKMQWFQVANTFFEEEIPS